MATNVFPESKLNRLAPDLTFPDDAFGAGGNLPVQSSIGVDVSTGGLVTVLSETGKFALNFLAFENWSTADVRVVKLTIDGDVKFNATLSSVSTSVALIGQKSASTLALFESYEVTSSILLEAQTDIDTAIDFYWNVRPIL